MSIAKMTEAKSCDPANKVIPGNQPTAAGEN